MRPFSALNRFSANGFWTLFKARNMRPPNQSGTVKRDSAGSYQRAWRRRWRRFRA
jgi:hypothetical protein